MRSRIAKVLALLAALIAMPGKTLCCFVADGACCLGDGVEETKAACCGGAPDDCDPDAGAQHDGAPVRDCECRKDSGALPAPDKEPAPAAPALAFAGAPAVVLQAPACDPLRPRRPVVSPHPFAIRSLPLRI